MKYSSKSLALKEKENIRPDADMVVSLSLGYARRWSVVFATTGTINTGKINGTVD